MTRLPAPSRLTINRITASRVTIYRHIPPPGRTIPVEVTPFPIKDSITEEAKVAEVVKRIRLNRSGGPSGTQVEHLRQWLWEAKREKYPDYTNWIKVVAPVQVEFLEGYLAESFTWHTFVIIPKGCGKDFGVIGIVEVLWKATTGIIIQRLTAVIH